MEYTVFLFENKTDGTTYIHYAVYDTTKRIREVYTGLIEKDKIPNAPTLFMIQKAGGMKEFKIRRYAKNIKSYEAKKFCQEMSDMYQFEFLGD